MSRSAILQLAPYLSRPAGEVVVDLEHYETLLVKWQKAHNLVSRETLPNLWDRHFLDSLQLLPMIENAQLVLDVGSGGGFPALPLAIALREAATRFELFEPVSRKAAFLRTVARELHLNVRVFAERVEQRDSRETPDIITARALAPLDELLTLLVSQSGPATRLLLHKGREHREEIVNAATQWRFGVIEHQSCVAPDSVILEISNLAARTMS